MRGLPKSCAGTNSCRTTRTRRMTIELDSYELYHAVYFGIAAGLGLDDESQMPRIDKLWERHVWPRLKGSGSYTVRVNGRATVKRGVVVNKRTRALVERRRKAAKG